MEKILKSGKHIIQFTEKDLKKIIGYTLYSFAEIGILNEKGYNMLDDKIEWDPQLISESGEGINLCLQELQEFGEVL